MLATAITCLHDGESIYQRGKATPLHPMWPILLKICFSESCRQFAWQFVRKGAKLGFCKVYGRGCSKALPLGISELQSCPVEPRGASQTSLTMWGSLRGLCRAGACTIVDAERIRAGRDIGAWPRRYNNTSL